MDTDELVRKYIDAWNQLDVSALLELMHSGAAYYDAFWAESCVGRDLRQYFQDAVDEDPAWYEQVGDTIPTDSGVAFRYSAHQRTGSGISKPILYGAEILSIEAGKILTVTDIYCSPNPEDLQEVATLMSARHGLTNHVDSGLGALKEARIKAGLSASIQKEKIYLDPDISLSQLADKVGCTLQQLVAVIEHQFGSNLGNVLDVPRVEHAKGLLQLCGDSSTTMEHIATSSGFASVVEFERKFSEIVGVDPMEYRSRKQDSNHSNGNNQIH